MPRELRSTRKNDDMYIYDPLNVHQRPKRGRAGTFRNYNKQNHLDTNIFESYLEDMWHKTTDDKKSTFTYLDSLWFSMYKDALLNGKENQKAKVLRWISGKEIFSKKYVFVPIVCWEHWRLLILCHFGEKIEAKNKPCMLLLDSLRMANPEKLEPDIRRFLKDVYETRNEVASKEFISKIPLLVPKVPQQSNGEECGVFVLYFIFMFMKNAPPVFLKEKHLPLFSEKWFDLDNLESFRKDVCSFSEMRKRPAVD